MPWNPLLTLTFLLREERRVYLDSARALPGGSASAAMPRAYIGGGVSPFVAAGLACTNNFDDGEYRSSSKWNAGLSVHMLLLLLLFLPCSGVVRSVVLVPRFHCV